MTKSSRNHLLCVCINIYQPTYKYYSFEFSYFSHLWQMLVICLLGSSFWLFLFVILEAGLPDLSYLDCLCLFLG